jgi:hypothetical protein
MNDPEPTNPPSKRFRFSLLTILFLMALVACGFTIWRQWRELVPLRVEVRQMRAELGHLSIDDETRPYAIQLHEWEDDVWRWRVYLPPGSNYNLYEASGVLPAHDGMPDANWLRVLSTAPNVSRGSYSSVQLQGTFLIEALLTPHGDGWRLRTLPGGGESVYRFRDDWLSNDFVRRSMVRSHAGVKRQIEFKPGEPIMLFYLAKPDITTQPGPPQHKGYGLPKDAAEGIVLWLGQ